jgi:hypothetical protein
LPGLHDPDKRKSAQRCAIATPLQEHESGTFDQCQHPVSAERASATAAKLGFRADLRPKLLS